MIGDEYTESAKAIQESAKAAQEVAKTTREGIEATRDLGGFVSRMIGEPADTVVGILTDRLKFIRWQRQVRLTDKAKEILDERQIRELRPISPKIALPIAEHATLEDNDELQDLWARLLVSAINPSDAPVRAAFIDIIRQLEVVDVHILNFVYSRFVYRIENSFADPKEKADNSQRPELAPEQVKLLSSELGIDSPVCREAVDNLTRVGCVTYYTSSRVVKVPKAKQNLKNVTLRNAIPKQFNILSPGASELSGTLETDSVELATPLRSDRIVLTQLGLSFARACMPVVDFNKIPGRHDIPPTDMDGVNDWRK